MTLKSTGKRKKSIKGYQFTYDIYKLMLMKFDSKILHYYIKLENIFMKYLEMLEQRSEVMQKLIASFSEEIKKKDTEIADYIKRNNHLEDLDSYHTCNCGYCDGIRCNCSYCPKNMYASLQDYLNDEYG